MGENHSRDYETPLDDCLLNKRRPIASLLAQDNNVSRTADLCSSLSLSYLGSFAVEIS